MRSKLLLRIAAALVLVHLLGHAIGHATWQTPEDPRMQAVVQSMKGYAAPFMGAVKSMADYYHGYSLIMFGLYGASIWILWAASGAIEESRTLLRRLLLPLGVVYVYFGIVEYLYFFPFAAVVSLLAGVLVLVAVGKR